MQLISVHIPRHILEEIDRLVQEGYFPNRSEAIRTALHLLIAKIRSEKNTTVQKLDNNIVIVPGRDR